MRKEAFFLGGLLVCLAVVVSGFAQEGHPLTGTWSGDWGPSLTERNHINLVMEWDGNEIGGFILVGVVSIPIETVALDVTGWTVRLEANGEDASGNAVEIAAEGQLEDIGSAHRMITGTWRQGAIEGDFMITRD